MQPIGKFEFCLFLHLGALKICFLVIFGPFWPFLPWKSAKNGRVFNYQTNEKLLQGAEKTIITRSWTSFPQWAATPVFRKNYRTHPKPYNTWKSQFQAQIVTQNVLLALKMDYLIAPKFHQFYPIVDPWSTGSQHHNFDRICLILQECIALMTSYLHAKHRTCTGPFLYYNNSGVTI